METNLDNIGVIFRKKNIPIPSGYRPLYKISLILLVLFYCSKGKKASLLKLQFFLWALKSVNNHEKFLSILSNQDSLNIWGLDPTVLRAINFGVAEQLLEHQSSNIKLSSKGKILIEVIIQHEDVFTIEKAFLKKVGINVSEKVISQISKEWSS